MSHDRDVASGAALAGIVLVVLPLLDLFLGSRAAAPVHATVAGFGLVLLSIAVARSAGKERR